MKSLASLLVAGAAFAASADFPADTLLPSRRVESSTELGFLVEETRYAYARDARGWLYETRTLNYSDTTWKRVDVLITDREGRYRGGSRLQTGDSLVTFEAVYGPEGRMDRRIVRRETLVFVEHYRYDARGNAVEKLDVLGNDTIHREFYPHTYDAQGRIATRKDFDGDSLHSTMVFHYDSLGRPAARAEYLDSWILRDSTVFEYRPDGRVHRELHFPGFGDSPVSIAVWEYRVWQVPLSLARFSRPARPSRNPGPGGKSPMGYLEGKAFDPLGRISARQAAGLPLFLRP